jgi:ribosomal protein S6--L-glutamate ligase
MKKLHLLVLATGSQNHLIKAIEDAGHTYDVHDPRSIYLFISESENGYDRVYDGEASLETPVRLKAKSYDAIIPRIGAGLEYGANVVTHFIENIGIFSTQTGAGLLTASNKQRTTMKLSSEGIRVPRTIGAYRPLHPDFLVKKVGGLPAIAKTLTGSQGRGVIILKDEEQTNTTLEAFWRDDTPMKLQAYIEGGKRDVRAIIVGNQVVSAMERTGVKDFRANLSQGGSGRKVELTDIQKDLCVRASQALGLNFSGVDLMIDEDKKAYVIEVNGNPGTGIIKITGQNHFVDLIRFIEDKVGKESKGTAKFESPEKAELQKARLEIGKLNEQLIEERDMLSRYKSAYEGLRSCL